MKISKLLLLLVVLPITLKAGDLPFSIYHTNDLHSHFDGVKYSSNNQNGYIKKGGFDRLATAIDNVRADKKAKGEIVIGVDAGDFFAGTLFSALGPTDRSPSFPEYEFLSAQKFDVVTLGNHEFDAKNAGLERMFDKASRLANGATFVATNLYLKDKQSKLSSYIGNNSLIKNVVIKDFKSEKGDLRVAFLGVLGYDACLVSKATRGDVGFVGFNDDKSKSDPKALINLLNPMIKELREKNQVQVVVITMHGGGEEVTDFAKKLKGVDIIIAGHTHEVQFSVTNGIIISQTGQYGENLGLLELKYDTETKKVALVDSKKEPLIKIDEKVASNKKWMERINNWRNEAFNISDNNGNDPEEVIFTPSKDYIRASKAQNPFGVFVSSILLSEINNNNANADFYFTSMSLIRTSLYKGVPYTRADLFELLSIGFDENMDLGVDTVTFYLTPKEVSKLVNFMELYSHISKNFAPAFSNNLSFGVSKFGVPFVNRIKNLSLNGKKVGDYNRLIKVATNRFVIDNLSTVGSATYGMVKIDPKNEKGESIRTYPTYPKEYTMFINYLQASKEK